MQRHSLFDLEGEVCFVTGAASGLGLAYAEVLAEHGAHVAMADIDAIRLAQQAERLAASGGRVEAVPLDSGDAAATRAAIDAIATSHGRLDSLFANVGISSGVGFAMGEAGRLENIDMMAWERILNVNITGTLVAMMAAVAHMTPKRRGRIIVTSSIAGIKAEPLVGYAYVASKAALNNMVRQAAADLAPYGILVNAIAPGPFLTNIGGGRLHRQPEIVAQFAEMVPLKRLGRPDEIKGLALLLASPAGSYMTGSVIPVDGGATAI